MILIDTLWNTLSLTSVNSVITLASIIISLWAAIAATCAARIVTKTYSNVRKFEFIAFAAKYEDVCSEVCDLILHYEKKPNEWNKGGMSQEKLDALSGLLTRLNKYYPLMTKEEKISIKENVKTIHDMLGNLHFFATSENLSQFRESINSLDQHIQEIASTYQLILLQD